MLARNAEHFVHVAAQTEKVRWNKSDDGLSVLVDQSTFDLPAIFLDVTAKHRRRNIVSVRIDVDEDWCSTDTRDAAAGCKERIRRRDHGISESDF